MIGRVQPDDGLILIDRGDRAGSAGKIGADGQLGLQRRRDKQDGTEAESQDKLLAELAIRNLPDSPNKEKARGIRKVRPASKFGSMRSLPEMRRTLVAMACRRQPLRL
jgi:hypothetical protein